MCPQWFDDIHLTTSNTGTATLEPAENADRVNNSIQTMLSALLGGLITIKTTKTIRPTICPVTIVETTKSVGTT